MDCLLTGNTGSKYCTTKAIFGDPEGIILAKDGFSMSAADFLDKDKWYEAINAGNIFPIMDLKAFLVNPTEVKYQEYDNDKRSFIKHGVYRFSVEFNKNQEQKKQLQSFMGFTQKFFFVYANDVIRGRSIDGGTNVEGIRISELVVDKERLSTTSESSMIPIHVDVKNYKDLNGFDYAMEVDWDVTELDGLTEVDLEQVGTASATELTISIYGTVYGKSYPITGTVLDDFSITGTGTLDSVVDNGDGTYTFATTGLITTDIVDLDAPADMTTQNLLIKSSGAVTVTVTP